MHPITNSIDFWIESTSGRNSKEIDISNEYIKIIFVEKFYPQKNFEEWLKFKSRVLDKRLEKNGS